MAGIKQPEGPRAGASAPSLPDAASRPAGGGAGPSRGDVAADAARLESLLRPGHRDGAAEDDQPAVRDDDDGGGRGGGDGEHEQAQASGDADGAAGNTAPDRGGSRAEGLLAFLGGARHQSAAVPAALTGREDSQVRPPEGGGPPLLGGDTGSDRTMPATPERLAEGAARHAGDDGRWMADERRQYPPLADARSERPAEIAPDRAADDGRWTADRHDSHGTASATLVPGKPAPDGGRLEAHQHHRDAAPPAAVPERPEGAARDRTAAGEVRGAADQQRGTDAALPGAAERPEAGALQQAPGDGRPLGGPAHRDSDAATWEGGAERGQGEDQAPGKARAALASIPARPPQGAAAVGNQVAGRPEVRDGARRTLVGGEAEGQADLQSRRHDGGGNAGTDRAGPDEDHPPVRQHTASVAAADQPPAHTGVVRHERPPAATPPAAAQDRQGQGTEAGGAPHGAVPAPAVPIRTPMSERRTAVSPSTRAASASTATAADRPSGSAGPLADDGTQHAGVFGRRHGGGASSDGGGRDEDEAPPGDPDAVSLAGLPQPPGGVPRTDDLLAFLDGAPRNDAPGASRAAEMAELAHTLTERILVGQRADGAQQIRVTLRGDLLGRTEVTIAQGADGLEVRFEPASDGAGHLLRERGAEFARTLSERLDSRVVVEVAATGDAGTGAGGGGRNSRSSGYDALVSYVAEQR